MSGGFFFVDTQQFARAHELGMNPMVAYLVMARGTLRDQSSTAWGVHAIEKYTGIGRRRARAAVLQLLQAGLIRPKRVGRFMGHHIVHSAAPTWACVPDSLIDGAAGECPPVERLRRLGAADPLLMLIVAYAYHRLHENSGLDWRLFRMEFTAKPITERGRWRLVAYDRSKYTSTKGNPLRLAMSDWKPFWDAVEVLNDQGLIEWVPTLVEGLSEESEIIHPQPRTTGTDVEIELGDAVNEAALALLSTDTPTGFQYSALEAEQVAIISDDFPNATVVGVGRLRYQPQNAEAGHWLEQSAILRDYITGYRDLAFRASGGEALGQLPFEALKRASSI